MIQIALFSDINFQFEILQKKNKAEIETDKLQNCQLVFFRPAFSFIAVQ